MTQLVESQWLNTENSEKLSQSCAEKNHHGHTNTWHIRGAMLISLFLSEKTEGSIWIWSWSCHTINIFVYFWRKKLRLFNSWVKWKMNHAFSVISRFQIILTDFICLFIQKAIWDPQMQKWMLYLQFVERITIIEDTIPV